jgi:lactate permease
MVALYPLSRWRRYAEPQVGVDNRPAMQANLMRDDANNGKAPMSLATASMPYVVLTVIALSTAMIAPIANVLRTVTVGLPFPEVSTGYDITNAAVARYSALEPLMNPGASLLLTAVLTWLIFRARGYYKAWGETQSNDEPGVAASLFASAVPASVPIIAFLVMARVMDHSGQIESLAHGIAAVAPTYVFAFLSNGIGVIGAFATSSSTSSNVLFSDLQVTLAKLKGLPTATILASQSAGGGIGNAIAPANLVLGASTAGISGQEGEILRKTLPWTLVAFVLTGIATVLLVLFAG